MIQRIRNIVVGVAIAAGIIYLFPPWGRSAAPSPANRRVVRIVSFPKCPIELTILKNLGYTVGYSETRRNPLWAAYRCERAANPQTYPRLKRFRVDRRTAARVSHGDYTNSGYSRGHMAPSYAIGTRYGKQAQAETYLLSNVCPQRQKHNGGPWLKLEMLIAKEYADVWVFCGPIFDAEIETLDSGVEIPDAFYMIVFDEQRTRAMAFIIEQESGQWGPLANYLTAIDVIEQQTGLDFLHELPDEIEDALEAHRAEVVW